MKNYSIKLINFKVLFYTFFYKKYLFLFRMKKLILSLTFLFALNTNCARTATSINANKVMQFIFKTKGSLILDRSDITYYVIFYAPEHTTPNQPLDPNIGPRVNAPDITRGIEFLEGRLPFIGQLPGDIKSEWTDFFYITAVNGKTVVGRGKKDNLGNPIIYDRNYANQNTKPITDPNGLKNGFQIEFFLSDLNNGKNNTSTINGNIAVSDSIENGTGKIYDYWLGNIPFSISLNSTSQQSRQDNTQNIILRKVPNRPEPTIPNDINQDSLNIVEYIARVTQ
jgi:hypothetical protein